MMVDYLTKMIYYEFIKVTIDVPDLAKVIINIVMRHPSIIESIVTNQGSLFISKFLSLLYYFLGIKRRLSTAFHSQTNGRTESENSTIDAYLKVLVNWEQNK